MTLAFVVPSTGSASSQSLSYTLRVQSGAALSTSAPIGQRGELESTGSNMHWKPPKALVPSSPESKLRRFADLPQGWDSYEALPISNDAIHAAGVVLSITRMMDCGLSVQPVPTSSGGVQLEWHGSNGVLEIEITNSGECELFATNVDGEVLADGNLLNHMTVLPSIFQHLR